MSKERLEEIKVVENWDNLNEWQFKAVAWLIEQAERVKELEGRKYRQELIDEHIGRLEKQNKRYREAIKKIKFLPDYVHSSTQHVEYINSIIVELEDSE